MKKLVLLFVLVLLMPKVGFAQIEKYKSVFTLNFIRYIGWPEEAKKGDFIIGVLKEDKVAEWLGSQSNGKKFGYQEVVIKVFNSVEEVSNCHVLYVASNINFSRHAEALLSKIGSNALVITETEGATKHGSVINFVVRDEVLKFEINDANAQKLGLSISSKLSTMTAAIQM